MGTFTDQIEFRANLFKGSFVPAFKADCEGRPYHAGTMTGMNFPGGQAFLTAAHVLDRDENNPCDDKYQIYVHDGSELTQIIRFDFRSIENRKLDLAFFNTQDVLVSKVFAKPIDLNRFHRGPVTNAMYLVACGYPGSKNRRKGKSLSNRPYGYFGKVSNDKATRRAGYDPAYYFSIEIDLKRVHRNGQKRVKAPNPSGISGGPVFLVHDFSSIRLIEPAFAGIVVAKDKISKNLICVRAEFIAMIASGLESNPAKEPSH